MTLQEIFDKVAEHLRTQGKRAYNGSKCVYRLPQEGGITLTCAVGCLIDDKHYSLKLENKSVGYLTVQDALIASGVGTEEQLRYAPGSKRGRPVMNQLLAELQRLHDNTVRFDNLEVNLRFIADQFGLKYTK